MGYQVMHVSIYLLLLVVCCLYASIRGGAPERWGVGILVAAVILSLLTPPSGPVRFASMEVGFLIVDSAMLVAVVALALRADRYWPMLMAAVLCDTVVTHLLMLSPLLMPYSYSVMIAAWSYPSPIILFVGAFRHRVRLRRVGSDRAWASGTSVACGRERQWSGK